MPSTVMKALCLLLAVPNCLAGQHCNESLSGNTCNVDEAPLLQLKARTPGTSLPIRIESNRNGGTIVVVRHAQNREIPLDVFLADAEAQGTALDFPIFLAFKVGRCGSTLLDKMLRHDPRYLTIMEPLVFNFVTTALPGSTSEDRGLRRRVFRALVLRFASMRKHEQHVVFLDLWMHRSQDRVELVEALPEAQSYLLWRTPIEVADSFYKRPTKTLLWKSHGHSGLLVRSIQDQLERTISRDPQELGMSIFWYQHVLNGQLVKWIARQAFGRPLDNQLFHRMMQALKYYSKSRWHRLAGPLDHDELKAPAALKHRGQVWYNPILVHFKTRFPPYHAQSLPGVKELSWPVDLAEIKRHFSGDLWQKPVLVKNAAQSFGLADKPGEALEHLRHSLLELKDTLNFLQAEKENLFVWHPDDKRPPRYHVLSKWVTGFYADFESNPTLQVIDRVPDGAIPGIQGNSSSVFKLFAPDSREAPSLRISHEGAVTALHYDMEDSMLVQLEGAKEVLLWPKSETSNLYPYPPTHFMFRRTLADPEFLDPVNLPNFDLEAANFIFLGPGDALYWPAGWAHHIRTVKGLSVSVGKRQHHRRCEPVFASHKLIKQVESLRYAKGFVKREDDDGDDDNDDDHKHDKQLKVSRPRHYHDDSHRPRKLE
eukprot:TRINITY_DN59470_c0_g1_i1.p1 TRINITY_DN59470_c0_g1~~TRINITY_DN59470_c0_g1_i1.p1  ORF type:complete len:678 (+),score=100.39 TRINITY_DN59470_c0_g1_i1:73-2034(+)